ncbi:MAG TPA: TetR/AcrR family transcriptional regulator [Nocardioides sp.]|uniref:TetR/AcrR family transcriptional regulator n=1 Tax=Nocardioides sp. TaxID=35761 RepID=UPI002F3FE9FD
MPVPSDPTAPRPRLTRERVLGCALGVADAGGIASLTIRSLAAELGVKPMSVYHHVANKEAILDGIVDLVFAEMELVPHHADGSWRDQVVLRARATRHALRRHPWAMGLLESRGTPGPATLRHEEETIRILREAGFSVEMTAHASALLDSFVCGFAVQEAARHFGVTSTMPNDERGDSSPVDPETYPHLAEMAEKHMLRPGYDFGEEFQLGLDLILGALNRAAHAGHLPPS